MKERKVADYTVTNSLCIGHKEIVMGENTKAATGERYLCCYVEEVAVFERYTEAVVSDDFAEIAKIFGERIEAAAEEIIKENEKAADLIKDNTEFASEKCTPVAWEDTIANKVVALRGDTLRPEFRHASYQLVLCTGGFGAMANARGRTCHGISLYDGQKSSFYRSDILGVVEPDKLPEWAQKGLDKAKTIQQADTAAKQTEEVSSVG